MVPGHCKHKAHERENLGVGGRRVLVSRRWSGKTLAAHKADRATVVRAALEAAGIDSDDHDELGRRG
jgi:Replication initiator protein, pSAM2